MYISPKKDCPHVFKDNLISIENLRKYPLIVYNAKNVMKKQNYGFTYLVAYPFAQDI